MTLWEDSIHRQYINIRWISQLMTCPPFTDHQAQCWLPSRGCRRYPGSGTSRLCCTPRYPPWHTGDHGWGLGSIFALCLLPLLLLLALFVRMSFFSFPLICSLPSLFFSFYPSSSSRLSLSLDLNFSSYFFFLLSQFADIIFPFFSFSSPHSSLFLFTNPSLSWFSFRLAGSNPYFETLKEKGCKLSVLLS